MARGKVVTFWRPRQTRRVTARGTAAADLSRPGREVEAAEQPTQADQVLYPLPFCQKANAGGLQRELGRRDEYRIPGREHRHEVELIRIGHVGTELCAPL